MLTQQLCVLLLACFQALSWCCAAVAGCVASRGRLQQQERSCDKPCWGVKGCETGCCMGESECTCGACAFYPDIGCSIERALVAATSSLEELSAVSVSSNTRSTSLFQETEVLDAADSLRDSLMRRAEL